MPLTTGATLGPYEILARAGAGGMGEVYKARDTRLNRTVAIKVLPAALTADPDARQRLDREAKAVAALSHPHICALFDIGHQDGTDFLVMEFLEGETLAERLTRGRLPIDEALRTGIQIADALATAHKAGIIHRDLKPGNIMLTTRGATLLDFGLAKPPPVALSAGVTQVATQQPLTSAGTLVGTLQYMAPEQLQGLPADARTDVFAFGCVLYEMVTGRRAFTGDTPASVIAAILEREPAPMAGGSDPIPVPVLDAIVRACLAKNPDDRWWSAHDVGVALARLGRVAEPTAHPRASRWPARWAALGWGIAALFFATTIAAVYRSNGRPEDGSTMSAVKSVIDFPNLVLRFPNLSPDGRYVSMFALSGDQEARTVVVRRLDDGAVTWLAGTERAQPVAWSPDSRSVAFLRDGELKMADVATGGVRTISRVPADALPDVTWNRDGVILLGGSRLRRLSAADGHPTDVYRPGAGVISQFAPSFLSDGRTFLYAQDSSDAQQRGVFLGSLDSPTVTRLLPEPANAAISPHGYFLYGQQGTVVAQRFDIDHKRLVGDPVNLGSDAGYAGPFTSFAVTGDLLVWANVQTPSANLTWVDRNGRIVSSTPEAAQYIGIALAPDEQRVAVTEADAQGKDRVSLIELTRPIHTRLTTSNQSESDPVWSPDSREVAFKSEGGLFMRRIDQDGRTTLLASSSVIGVQDWTHDGRFVIFGRWPHSVWALPLTGDRTPVPVIESSASVDEARVSRDGRWLAYSGNDTGQWEVYVQPFMRPGGRVRVSTNGGSQPRWRGDGRELFYLALDGTMMSVRTADPATPDAAQKLFQRRLAVNPVEDQYDVTADGQRFLVIDPEGQPTTRLTVLTNWPAALKPR
jgi:serine/threonine protein kinase/Tol biopolymer transport system component